MKILTAILALLCLYGVAHAQSINPTIVTGTTIGTSPVLVSVGHPRLFLEIDNPAATASIACTFGTAYTATINGAGSIQLGAGAYREYDLGFIPPDNLYCIASAASTPITVLER